MNCPFCQSPVEDSAVFCPECGKRIAPPEEPVCPPPGPEGAPVPPPPPPVSEEAPVTPPPFGGEAPIPPPPPAKEEKSEAEPAKPEKGLSTGAYMALELLFALPVVGIIFLFIWSAGHPKNDALRRFSASVLIWRLIFWAVLLILGILFLLLAGKHLTKFPDALQAFFRALQ